MRNYLRIAAGLAAAAALGGVAVAVAGATKPTGNARAIAYARAVAQAYARVRAVRFNETGYVSMDSYLGKVSGFAWSWGTGLVPTGWVHATERVVVGLHAGRVVWSDDVLRPQPCGASHCSQEPPVEIVVTRRGNYWRFALSGPVGACYRKLSGSVPLSIGHRFVSVEGRFRPLVRQGAFVTTDRTFPWDTSQTAAEIDTISAPTKLVSGRLVLVSHGSGPQMPAFAFAATYATLKKANEPKVKLCL
jgi:hypothetical protein